MLPKIPYSMEKNKSESVPIGTLNLSCNFKPGDIAYSRGISLRKYPYLTTKKADSTQHGYSNVLAMTVFDGKLVTVRRDSDNSGLSAVYVEYERVCGLFGTEPRQFASINNKLVIFPDKCYLERVDGSWSLSSLENEEILKSGATKFESDHLKAIDRTQSVRFGMCGRFDAAAKSFSIDPQTTIYQPTNSSARYCVYRNEIITVEPSIETAIYSSAPYERFILILKNDWIKIRQSSAIFFTLPSTNGFLLELNKAAVRPYPEDTEYYRYSFVDPMVETGPTQLYVASNKIYNLNNLLSASDLCWVRGAREGQSLQTLHEQATVDTIDSNRIVFKTVAKTYGLFDALEISITKWKSGIFDKISAGDTVSFIGSDNNKATYTIKEASQFKLTFEDDSVIEEEKINGEIGVLIINKDAFSGFKEGDCVTVSGCIINDDDSQNIGDGNNTSFVISRITDGVIYASADIFTPGESVGAVTVKRSVPHLDFICERDNRLYGVCNAEKTLYVSALGDPTNMYVYEGVSTDSFAVAVGGEGDFTGCCKYGEGVIFFKQDKLYKLTGSYPADFALYSYDVEGVAIGSRKSMAVINEVLYYHGKSGIFAYTGGIPTLISSNFGEYRFSDAICGTDGVCYYVSAWNVAEDDDPYLLSYNTRLGLWVLEDKVRCIDFARTPYGSVYATEDGEVYLMNASSDASGLEWEVQFVPTYETIAGKKIYSRLLLRCEIPRGSYVIIEIRSDGGEWCEAGKILGMHNNVIPVRLPIARCDKFELRLRGKGEFTLLDILREYHVGSEV